MAAVKGSGELVILLPSSPKVNISKLIVPDVNEGVGFEDGLDKCFTLCVTSKNEGTNLVRCGKLQSSN